MVDDSRPLVERRPFGWTRTPVPIVGQGTWMLETALSAEAVKALRTGLDLGMTHLDTAEMYGQGRVEELVGLAIRGRREEVFLVSKVLPGNATRKGTVRACERSLERLGTDHLDCYLLHWRGDIPLSETFAAFESLVEAGKIRSWGVSNFDSGDLKEAVAIAGPERIACNQVLYNLEGRQAERRALPWCIEHRAVLVGYSPFGHGAFPEPSHPRGKVLAEIARKHGGTPRQVALAFLVRDPHVFVIPKSGHVDRVRENAASATLRLSGEDVAAIDRAFPVGRGAIPVL